MERIINCYTYFYPLTFQSSYYKLLPDEPSEFRSATKSRLYIRPALPWLSLDGPRVSWVAQVLLIFGDISWT